MIRRPLQVFYSFANFNHWTSRTPEKSKIPKRINPREKEPNSPMSPIPAGMIPPPMRIPTAEVKEMATFLILGELI